ncbi:MAG: hypothetical protein IJD57_01445 [Candidatus Gastranaerophilales bacterium]|nr:hypothetical protein [Candidatus Gastranaerophilales bacterium]
MKILGIDKNNYSRKSNFDKLSNCSKQNNAINNDFVLQNSSSKNYEKLQPQHFSGYFAINPVSKVSFGANNEQKADPVLDFGISLFDKLQSNKDFDLVQETKNFLKQNDLEDIDIADLDEIKYQSERLLGGFRANFSKDMSYDGGTLFLENYSPSNDSKANAKIAGAITHELSHAYQHKNKNGLEMFTNAGLKKSDDLPKVIRSFIERVKRESVIRDMMQVKPLQYAVDNFRKIGIDVSELLTFNPDIYKYSTIFPESSVKIDEKTIINAFSCNNEEDFESLVADYFSQTLYYFKESDIPEKYKNNDTYKLIQSYATALLRDEAIAYQKNSQINKHRAGLSFDAPTLNDLIPMTYNKVANILEKLDVEKCAQMQE